MDTAPGSGHSAGVKITEVRVHRHELVVAGGKYQMSTSAVDTLDSTVVEVITDDGLVGFGETTPLGPTYQPQHAFGARAAIAQIAPALLGVDPRRHQLVSQRMDSALNGHAYAKAALDVASWDITAKSYDERLCDVLGGTTDSSVKSYYGVMPADTDATAAVAVRRAADGYTRLQVKAGGRPLSDDIAAVRAVADAVGPGIRLLVDANRGWTPRDTIEFSIACRDLPLSIEQPCRTLDEHIGLGSHLSHPLFLDESATDLSTISRAIIDGTAQGFGLKLSRLGGITPFLAVRDLCVARGIPFTVDDTWGGDITAASTVHFGATVPAPFHEGTWIAEPYTASSYAVRTPAVRPVSGRIPVPEGPGLGVEPDTDAWPDPVAVYR